MVRQVNLHGSFALGLSLAAGFVLEALLKEKVDRRRVFVSWSVMTEGGIAGGLNHAIKQSVRAG
jgi:hypothetical protein